MALKTEPQDEDAGTPEERKCECGDHADFVDGLCRRCRLSE